MSIETYTLDQALCFVQVSSLTSIPEVEGRHVVGVGGGGAVEFGVGGGGDQKRGSPGEGGFSGLPTQHSCICPEVEALGQAIFPLICITS